MCVVAMVVFEGCLLDYFAVLWFAGGVGGVGELLCRIEYYDCCIQLRNPFPYIIGTYGIPGDRVAD